MKLRKQLMAIGCVLLGTPAFADWLYEQEIDKMRGSVINYASVRSDNVLDFSFPYDGGSIATLGFRLRDPNQLEAYLMISKGQFTCSGYSYDVVSVKFDQRPLQEFRCNQAADGDTKTIFINDAMGFLRQMQSTSKIIIEASFYQEGSRQLNFSVAGIRWSTN
ncbi:hypothetical protein [Rhizobium leguminosarum]|uniref:Uncharacterized protein n=1 Tax=Rhizobium leguminosarum TaxID=384 RepID=A0A6P0B763_RHILE|nr:hypothetical protein [Rhizobium leguminosarum]MBY5438551.1 hypothetical protein [Rhizobium leguminosarum]NEI35747.1 hypothetical protein [Rhizobium leguminosarum]NEI42130.1 hypothetical protein [Rhizobium leguminosarum]